jgi:hypothetical protein
MVVELGVTLAEPVGPKVPTPGMVTDVALVVVQSRTAGDPGATMLGWALKLTVGGGPAVVTLTSVED